MASTHIEHQACDRSQLQRSALQDYRNRDCRAYDLDQRVFAAMNDRPDDMFIMTSGCLDALDQMPAGSMKKVGAHYHDQSLTSRGQSAAQIAQLGALAARLIDELLNERKENS